MTASSVATPESRTQRVAAVLGDTDIQRVSVSELLTQLDVEALVLSDPDHAFQVLRSRRRRLDLLIVDLCQLDFDGLGALAWLKSKGLLGEIPVWVVEDPFEPTSLEVCQACSISRCLSKSSTPEEIAGWISETLFQVAQDKRRHPRAAVFAPAVLGLFERKVAGYLTDISIAGAFIQTTAPFSLGTRVTLKFQLPNMAEPISIRGRVVRSNAGGSRRATGIQVRGGMGLEFEELSPVARASIVAYVERTSASKRVRGGWEQTGGAGDPSDEH